MEDLPVTLWRVLACFHHCEVAATRYFETARKASHADFLRDRHARIKRELFSGEEEDEEEEEAARAGVKEDSSGRASQTSRAGLVSMLLGDTRSLE